MLVVKHFVVTMFKSGATSAESLIVAEPQKLVRWHAASTSLTGSASKMPIVEAISLEYGGLFHGQMSTNHGKIHTRLQKCKPMINHHRGMRKKMVLSASTIFLPSVTTALKQLAFLVVWLWHGRFLIDQNHPPKSFGSYSPSSPLLHHAPTSYASIKAVKSSDQQLLMEASTPHGRTPDL